MAPDHDQVCVLIPTLNEAETIGDVIDGFREQGFENVLVVDGHSTDGTPAIAEDHGARVLEQSGSGKGRAVREALTHVDAPYVLMIDGDGTYRPEDAEGMLEPIVARRAEHVIGNRFANLESGAMDRLHRVGNRLVNRAFALIHGRDLRDILSGYRAFTRESVERYSLTAGGFGIETELAVECVRHGTATAVVPITYRPRPAESQANLNSFRDGARIVHTLYRLAKTNNPVFYFGSVGAFSVLLGLLIGTYVGYDWFVNAIGHQALAVVSAFFILLGVQLTMFGVLTDVIVSVNREQTRRLDELVDRLGTDASSGVEFDAADGVGGERDETAENGAGGAGDEDSDERGAEDQPLAGRGGPE